MSAKTYMNRTRDGLIATIFATCASLFQPNTCAQQSSASAPQGSAAPLEGVIVTGSRIPVPATSPTNLVSSQDVQLQGHTDITDVISQPPQNIISSNAGRGNTSTPLTATCGFPTGDLCGLSPRIDGKYGLNQRAS